MSTFTEPFSPLVVVKAAEPLPLMGLQKNCAVRLNTGKPIVLLELVQ